MTAPRPATTTLRAREIGRRAIGVLLAAVFAAYGAGAGVSTALSDEDSVAGKGGDALGAVSVLQDRYEAAKYLADNRDEIRAALDYVNENTPRQPELRKAAAESAKTLTKVTTTFDEVESARDALSEISVTSPRSLKSGVQEALRHARNAVAAVPDVRSLR